MRDLDRHQVTTILTLIIVAVWIIGAVVRLFVPWPEMRVLDSALPLVVGYWFVSAAIKRNGGQQNGVAA